MKTRRRHPVTQGEKLRSLAACLRTREDLEQALEGFSAPERTALLAGLLPYLKFELAHD
jgi:hypothetical protein